MKPKKCRCGTWMSFDDGEWWCDLCDYTEQDRQKEVWRDDDR